MIAGHVRLDERDDLVRELGEAPSDLSLVARAYARWGDACAERLVGDFAFAIRDARRRRVFAARDALGVRPLCYRVSAEGIALAPTPSSLGPLEIREEAVAEALVPALEGGSGLTATPYRDVLRLAPGHTLVFENGRATQRRYWTPDPLREIDGPSDAEHEEAFRGLFSGAVRRRLHGAASMLSGGLDSSAIVGFARRLGPITTLSAVTGDPGCEESAAVRSVLALGGVTPVLLTPGGLWAYRDEIERFLRELDDPADASMVIPLLVYVEARRRGFTAVLDGVDGDCVASLEPDYVGALLRGGSWGAGVREAIGTAAFYRGTFAPWSSASRVLLSQAFRAWAPDPLRNRHRRGARTREVRRVLSDSLVALDAAVRNRLAERLEELFEHRAAAPSSIRGRHAAELIHPHLAAALERYQRVAASQGLEARHPFLDRRLVEHCLALPWDQKVRRGVTKSIVRRACRGVVPDEVRWRRGRWVRLGPRFLAAAIGALRPLLEEELANGLGDASPFLDRRKLGRAVEELRAGASADGAEKVWHAVALNSWLRKTRTKRYDPVARTNGPAAPDALFATEGASFYLQGELHHGV